MKSSPAAHAFSDNLTGKRIRFAYDPPHSSVRLFVWAAMNWFDKYPSLPITSTPS